MITYIPPGKEIPWEGLERGARTNNDGHGWAVASTALGLEVGKSMDFTEAAVDLAAARERHGKSSVAIFHSRWGTHGVMGEFNVHPFFVDNSKQTVMAHNGILSSKYHPLKKDPRSDTRIFVDEVAGQFLSPETGIPSRRRGIALGNLIGLGNKLIFLSVASGSPKVRIINAWLGEWEGGIWYSNSGYRPFRSYYNTGSARWGSEWWDDGEWYGGSSRSGGYWDARDKKWVSSPPRQTSGRRLEPGIHIWNPIDGTEKETEGADDGTEVSAEELASEESTTCKYCGETDAVGGVCTDCNPEVNDCEFCGARGGVNPLTAICEYCESCAECFETAADCQCYNGSHHRMSQELFDVKSLAELNELLKRHHEGEEGPLTNPDAIALPTAEGWRSEVYE